MIDEVIVVLEAMMVDGLEVDRVAMRIVEAVVVSRIDTVEVPQEKSLMNVIVAIEAVMIAEVAIEAVMIAEVAMNVIVEVCPEVAMVDVVVIREVAPPVIMIMSHAIRMAESIIEDLAVRMIDMINVVEADRRATAKTNITVEVNIKATMTEDLVVEV